MMDKRDRATQFRLRLSDAIATSQSNMSALARAAGVSRSTISQLLDPTGTRLPNAQLAADCAQALGVSTDWLLGLTDRPERPGDIVAASVQLARAARSGADDQIMEWHRESQGYKVRHVPATLPDMLKTKAHLSWEYQAFLGKTPDQAIGAMEDRINWLRGAGTDYEIAMPIHELHALASGAGYYQGCPAQTRQEQLAWLTEQVDTLYPSLRLYLFDARRVFSAPITVFGPRLGVIYVGQVYIAFRETPRVQMLSSHFDGLIREAEVDASRAATWMSKLQIT